MGLAKAYLLTYNLALALAWCATVDGALAASPHCYAGHAGRALPALARCCAARGAASGLRA